jgi:hypothetical protein
LKVGLAPLLFRFVLEFPAIAREAGKAVSDAINEGLLRMFENLRQRE